MKHVYTKETLMPMLVEVTYQDVANIKRLADLFLAMETKPTDFWESDVRRLRDEAAEALSKASAATIFLRTGEVE